jgi:hypothetical protein
MSEYSIGDLADNPSVEPVEVTASPFTGTGLPADPPVERLQAFAWHRDVTRDETAAHDSACSKPLARELDGQRERYEADARGYSDDQLIAAIELGDDPNDPLNLGGRRTAFMYAMTAEVLRRAETVGRPHKPAA